MAPNENDLEKELDKEFKRIIWNMLKQLQEVKNKEMGDIRKSTQMWNQGTQDRISEKSQMLEIENSIHQIKNNVKEDKVGISTLIRTVLHSLHLCIGHNTLLSQSAIPSHDILA